MELFLFFQFIPFTLHACYKERQRIEEATTWERLAFKIRCDRLTELLKLMAVCPPSPPLSTSPRSLALVMALNLSLAFWRAQMATGITMMARWMPPRW